MKPPSQIPASPPRQLVKNTANPRSRISRGENWRTLPSRAAETLRASLRACSRPSNASSLGRCPPQHLGNHDVGGVGFADGVGEFRHGLFVFPVHHLGRFPEKLADGFEARAAFVQGLEPLLLEVGELTLQGDGLAGHPLTGLAHGLETRDQLLDILDELPVDELQFGAQELVLGHGSNSADPVKHLVEIGLELFAPLLQPVEGKQLAALVFPALPHGLPGLGFNRRQAQVRHGLIGALPGDDRGVVHPGPQQVGRQGGPTH